MRSARRNPGLAWAVNAMAVRAQRWMLEAAGIGTAGPRGALRAQGAALMFARVLSVWIDDEDESLDRTMAALDRGLASAERWAGLFVVAAIFVSACIAGVEAISRLIHPEAPTHLLALAVAGLIGFGGNWLAAIVRTRAGRRLDSPALIADGNHARVDAYVSLAVLASAIVVALGLPIADPLIGLGITVVILKITLDSWRTVRGHSHHH
jgi:hypothetical protein